MHYSAADIHQNCLSAASPSSHLSASWGQAPSLRISIWDSTDMGVWVEDKDIWAILEYVWIGGGWAHGLGKRIWMSSWFEKEKNAAVHLWPLWRVCPGEISLPHQIRWDPVTLVHGCITVGLSNWPHTCLENRFSNHSPWAPHVAGEASPARISRQSLRFTQRLYSRKKESNPSHPSGFLDAADHMTQEILGMFKPVQCVLLVMRKQSKRCQVVVQDPPVGWWQSPETPLAWLLPSALGQPWKSASLPSSV